MKDWLGQYHDEESVAEQIAAGKHREIIGGMWDELGQLQFDFLRSRGMAPEHSLLDLGCGAGRLAVKAAPYLNHGRYYGVDISPSLLEAAKRELEAVGVHFGDKLRRAALTISGNFQPPLDAPPFDFIMAQSLFTHLPIDKFAAALDALRPRVKPGQTKFYATFFLAPCNTPQLRHEPGGITTYPDRDPFHFAEEQIVEQATYRRWKVDIIGAWNHPRDQRMFEFIPLQEAY